MCVCIYIYIHTCIYYYVFAIDSYVSMWIYAFTYHFTSSLIDHLYMLPWASRTPPAAGRASPEHPINSRKFNNPKKDKNIVCDMPKYIYIYNIILYHVCIILQRLLSLSLTAPSRIPRGPRLKLLRRFLVPWSHPCVMVKAWDTMGM